MIRKMGLLSLSLILGLWISIGIGIEFPVTAQSAQDVCSFIEQLKVSQGLKGSLCQDFQAGIARGHIQPSRVLELLKAINERINPNTQAAAESILMTVGFTINPAKGDLPAELLIIRVFEIFSREQTPGELMGLAAREVSALSQTLQGVSQVYRGLDIFLERDVSKKVIQTEFGEVELTVGRLDTVITATAVALDRFERRLDRRLDDFSGMKAEVMKELRAPSFFGAEQLPSTLIQYIDAHTTGQEWAPIVSQLAASRGRTS